MDGHPSRAQSRHSVDTNCLFLWGRLCSHNLSGKKFLAAQHSTTGLVTQLPRQFVSKEGQPDPKQELSENTSRRSRDQTRDCQPCRPVFGPLEY